MVTVRTATEQDLPAMLEIYNDVIANTTAVWHYEPHTLAMRQEWFAQRKQQGFPVFVAEEDGKILGFSTYGSFRPWPGYKNTVENSVYVAADSRGKGISKLLLPPLIEAAKQGGIHAVIAAIDAENEISIALHKKFGFVEVGHLKEVGWKFERWLDLKLMELIL